MSDNTIPMFDYGNITDEQKNVIKEVASFLENSNQHELADVIKKRFKVIETPRYDLTKSKFYQEAQKAGVFVAVQGFVQEGLDGDAIQYQLCAVCDDIRNLDKFIDSIKSDKD
jgi:hypothetical protein